MQASATPVLSVVTVIVSDTIHGRADASHLVRCLEGLCAQVSPPPMEVIVPHYPAVKGLNAVMAKFPEVRFAAVADLTSYTGKGGSREHHDELRARGLALAQGEIIAMLEDHGVPDPEWAAAVVDAHRRPFAAIGGPMENGVDRPLNWAVYFCDFGKYQAPLPDGESDFASDANVSYKRAALQLIYPLWRDSYRETEVHGALRERGLKLALCPRLRVSQHRQVQLSEALRERYIWGRSYAATRSTLVGPLKRCLLAVLSPALPFLIVARMSQRLVQKGRNQGAFLRALPLIAVLSAAWTAGELAGYLSGPARGRQAGMVAPAGQKTV